jgi:[ribosomal protein S5]-alanine N-acetyltransferase
MANLAVATSSLNLFQIESTRLVLVPLSWQYKDVIFREFTSEITRFMYPKPTETLDETEKFVKTALLHLERGVDLTWTILKKPNLEFVGLCALHRVNTETPEFGIWIKKAAQGQKLGKEAIHAAKDWADETLQYQYLAYSVDRRNLASRKIPESLGGQIVREYQLMSLSGNLLELLEYRIYPQSKIVLHQPQRTNDE